ncbi:hypothetical protein C1X59_24455 [Pseudomonas sp. FW215-R2]|uniref:hypothetical protein n=1 Tax=unclassified Pseudomonas TaxID=196821 RepID=UPI000C889525|nr:MULTISPECIES: hypothetical protein [unclassified Pseudomonas]PMW96370.1 hypothetical protein C1X59_24455 [Pseudomonas sp. FW215-R2]PMX07263.1 hypothetical protein C1X60_21190 [Pseudomonas sp. FW215-L1]PMX20078.1 hypothetical protein C1X57_23025 [Pseudomonas sp. FW215-E1]PNA20467.1 hypothetical protein C1X58_29765 [Pseudomonas sp. FW215-R4]
MIDSLEVKEFDRLEGALIEANVSFGEMTRQYARYLLSLIDGGVLATISDSKLKTLIPYIEEGILRERIENDGDLRKKLAIELWEIEAQHRKSDENFANLIRCVIFCFGTEDRWIEEGTGDTTPIYLYFLGLKKILPDIRQGFIKVFKDFIADRRKID